MREYEHAYLLDEIQLLQLLSCLDDKPVFGLMSRDPNSVPASVWIQAVFSLAREGWLEPVTNGFAMPACRAALLQTIKHATHVLYMLFRGEDAPMRTLYLGIRSVAVELYGPEYYRVYDIGCPPQEWLEGSLAECPLEGDEPGPITDTDGSLEALATGAPSMETPAIEWGRRPGIHAVLDWYSCDGPVKLFRWIFLSSMGSGAIIHQDSAGTRVVSDTPEQRDALWKTCMSGLS